MRFIVHLGTNSDISNVRLMNALELTDEITYERISADALDLELDVELPDRPPKSSIGPLF